MRRKLLAALAGAAIALVTPVAALAFTPLTATATAACVSGTVQVTVEVKNDGPVEAEADVIVGTTTQHVVLGANGTKPVTIPYNGAAGSPIVILVTDTVRGETAFTHTILAPACPSSSATPAPSGGAKTGAGGSAGTGHPVAGAVAIGSAVLFGAGLFIARRRRV